MITGSESARLQIHEEVRKVSSRRKAWTMNRLSNVRLCGRTQARSCQKRRNVRREGSVVSWGNRTRQELRPSVETSRARTPGSITPQQLQIARMAAEGMTNREIGQKLYLSHRTAGAHLRRILQKLLHSWATAPRTNPSEGRRKPVTHRCPDARAVM
jgi:DNA-binding CsgD family transcriptional regulator